jgi:hypothetical protein
VLGFSEYSCNAGSSNPVAANGGLLSFAFTGNTGGTGVGGNATTPVFAFVIQPGLYQLVFNTSAQFIPASPSGQPRVVVLTGGLTQVSSFALTGLEAPTPPPIGHVAVGHTSLLWSVTSPNQTLSFEVRNSDGITGITFSDCTLMIVQLQ